MALTEDAVVDKIEVYEDGSLNVRTATRVFRDGVRIAETYHRQILTPGSSLDGQPQKVVDVANAVWTQDVLDAYPAP